MGFIEYYNRYRKHCSFYWGTEIPSLPSDVREDLENLIRQNDKRIGIGYFKDNPSAKIYYVRSKCPDIVWHEIWFGNYYIIRIPFGLRFWRRKRNAIL